MAPALVLEDVYKKYRIYHERYRSVKEIAIHRRLGSWEDRWALRGVSLEVQRGETLALVGPNGAGKSTALKVMARILTPDRGRIQANGRLSALIELGAGFQLEYTGRENVYLNASLLGLTKKEVDRKYDDIVAFSELEDHMEASVRTYSTGMYMRLGFSVAIHVEPEILLVDEILAVGDASFQQKCTDWLEGFQRRGGTIVMVSHSLASVRQLANKAAWIEHGNLLSVGDPIDVIAEYLGQVREHRHDEDEARRAHQTRRPDIELTQVTLSDAEGRPVEELERGDPLQVRISYRCHRAVPTPVFGVALHRDDGSLVYGTNTHVDGVKLDPITKDGSITIRYQSLPLLGSTYLITVAIFGSTAQNAPPIDFREQRYSIRVTPRTDEQGSAYLPHDWVLEPVGISKST
ncbi:MAG TPA: ABC transporter ATP-binding protein [Candidatus Dormibacteraeota bacterium]|jgi:ABC-type polysaccharide/polyol phosphate transport system ATPase subunit|nr:ABC transporter ATP-binding protein [Candidatus Dormibacteraeota bacterium]